MEAFLNSFKAILEEMTEETFDTNAKSLIARKLEKYDHLSQESGFDSFLFYFYLFFPF